MSENKLADILKSFDQNQLREINAFLSSAKGSRIKNALSNTDKEKLVREFGKIDINAAKRKIQSMSSKELSELIGRLGG